MRTNHPQSQASLVFFPDHFKTIQHVNIHEIVFHNLNLHNYIERSLTPWNKYLKKTDVSEQISMSICTMPLLWAQHGRPYEVSPYNT